MKKLLLFLFIVPFVVAAQKPVKPSLSKAEKALREGKFDEAKAIIDATVASEKFADNSKAWYLKGLIYGGIDTTSNEAYKSLIADPFPEAKAAFDKAYSLDKDKGSFINGPNGFPLLTEQVNAYFAQKYFDKALKAYQDDKDYPTALREVERTLYFVPNDTSILLNAGLFFAPSADEHQKSIEFLQRYLDNGGTSSDAYTMIFSAYRDQLKDNDKALETVMKAMKAHPENKDFPKYELDMYIRMGKLQDAKSAMERQAANDPNDAETRYFLGVINQQLGNNEEARKWYDESVKLDPKYFEPRLAIAELVFLEAKKIKAEMNQLGITAEDKKKRFELDKVLVENLKKALPYWEACEKISPDDEKVLDNLYSIYTDLDMQAQMQRIEKKMKALGLF
ncbi:MAG TPA: tetratricopeptide repeat protein [Cyclobacteriaceae bacterium]|nr:tetratricopeptide repeat protein [Cyclobacteriaceae bacterium]MCB9236369.1 tetratricopeptide repeat protein [Flammeovirgaceae bacterium]MCO5272312.1 tetratricopeptide repeat protein [Cyclobacteriaceae bacterium]MCW5902170.1 tetratricopeptide repeat protein [Cyclobacteriaceae bacterium]HOO09981.1 tetratricopeptide repeat protein [Cyclobacteriaceae bacterium]